MSLQDWLDAPVFYAVLVLALLLCIPLLFRHTRDKPKDESRHKRRNFWHRR